MKPRFQFSLRTLFVVVTILAVACAVGATVIQEWQKGPELQLQSYVQP